MKTSHRAIGLFCLGLVAACHRTPQATPSGSALPRPAASASGAAPSSPATGGDAGAAAPGTTGAPVDPNQQAMAGPPAPGGDHLALTIQR